MIIVPDLTESDNLAHVLADLDPLLRGFAFRTFAAEWEDALQEARIGVISAFGRFDSSHNVPVRAWCYQRGKGAVTDYLRMRVGRAESTKAQTIIQAFDDVTLYDDGFTDRAFADIDNADELVDLFDHCTVMQRHVMGLFLIGMTGAEVSVERGVTDAATTHALRAIRLQAFALGIGERRP